MREKRTVSFNPETDELPEGRTDFQRLDNQTDEEIARAVADDPDAAPLLEGDLPPGVHEYFVPPDATKRTTP